MGRSGGQGGAEAGRGGAGRGAGAVGGQPSQIIAHWHRITSN